MANDTEESQDRIQQLLDARARTLSRPPEQVQAKDALDVVLFTLQDEQYAVDVRLVREVYPFGNVTPVPCTPDFVLGILNLRGSLYPVLDLRRFFGLESNPLPANGQALLVSSGGMELCLRADAVSDVISLALCDLGAPLETHTTISRDFIRGIGDSMLVFLDLAALLADARLVVQDEIG